MTFLTWLDWVLDATGSHTVMGDLEILFLLSMGSWYLVVLAFVSIARSMG